ncbi:unnamed protein product, partial [Phaeothamnion confervicola]
ARAVGRLFDAALAATSATAAVTTAAGDPSGGGGGGGSEAGTSAAVWCKEALESLRRGRQWRSPALVDVAVACLADCLPPTLAFEAARIAAIFVERLERNNLGGSSDSGSHDGGGGGGGGEADALQPLCVAMACRRLPPSQFALVARAAAVLRERADCAIGLLFPNGGGHGADGSDGGFGDGYGGGGSSGFGQDDAAVMWAAAAPGLLAGWAELNVGDGAAADFAQTAAEWALQWLRAASGQGGDFFSDQ